MPAGAGNFAAGSPRGSPSTPATCRGGAPAIPTRSGSAKSCFSKPRSRRLGPTSSGSSGPCPRSRPWPTQTNKRSYGSGKGWATTAAHASCTKRPARSSPVTAAFFPRQPQAVRELPGIGRYTAGAILSIAFDDRQPILEANTLRLFSRLLSFRGLPTSTEGSRLLWAMAEAVLPRRDVGRFNQALMELGSTICTPKAPQCLQCPVATLCGAHEPQDCRPAFRHPSRNRHSCDAGKWPSWFVVAAPS